MCSECRPKPNHNVPGPNPDSEASYQSDRRANR